MPELSMFILSFLVPALSASAVLSLLWMIPSLRNRPFVQESAFGWALALGLFASYFSEKGLPSFPPDRSDQWIGLFALALLPLSSLMAWTSKKPFPWTELSAIALGASVAFLPLLASGDSFKPLFPSMAIAEHAVVAVLIAFGCIVLLSLQNVRAGAALPLAFAMAFTAGSLTALASGWISMAIYFGVVAAVSGAGMVYARIAGSPFIGRGSVFVVAFLLVVLPSAAWYKTTPPEELHWWLWVLAAGAPMLLLLCENRFFEKRKPATALLLRGVVVAVPIIIVLIHVVPILIGEAEGSSENYDDMMKMSE